jgi:predicted  nucleic acid-binding Zn-ribbon protein
MTRVEAGTLRATLAELRQAHTEMKVTLTCAKTMQRQTYEDARRLNCKLEAARSEALQLRAAHDDMKYGIEKEQKKRDIAEKAQMAAEAISGELRRQALQAKEGVDKAQVVAEGKQWTEEKLQEKNKMVAAEATELQFAISIPSPWKQEHFSVCIVSRPVGHRR